MGELSSLREYSSMNYCLDEIPQRVRRGLSIVEVHFTCVDAVEEFIVIGTNVGVVYWCNRRTNKIERLRPEKYGPAISAVKVVSTVDYMVAAGDASGVISVFVIPKKKPVFLPADHENARRGIERFTAGDLHASPVTSIVWSINGQKLFTGDEKGVVAYTQMDFQLNIIKSMEVLNEKFPIVQLAYRPQILLVTSEYRCIIYKQASDMSNQEIYQVGQKERGNLSKLGGIIGSHPSEVGPVIYSARPKQRIWLANTEGVVCRTLLFKEPLSQRCPEIQISRPFGTTDLKSQESSQNSSMTNSLDSLSSISCDVEFNYFHEYKHKFLLTHNAHSLFLLNPETTTVEAGFTTKRILSVAVNTDEIFVLEGCRRVRRISFSPDPHCLNEYCNANPEMPIGDKLLEIVHKIKEETSTNMMQSFIENYKKVESVVLNSQVMNGREDLSPAEEALHFSYPREEQPREYSTQHLRTSYDVDDSCSDIIVHNRQKKKSHTNIERMNSDPSKEQTTSREVLKLSPFKEVPNDIMPDLRTPTSIQYDVEQKELIIAHLLNLDDQLPSSSQNKTLLDTKDEEHQPVATEVLLTVDQISPSINCDHKTPESDSEVSSAETKTETSECIDLRATTNTEAVVKSSLCVEETCDVPTVQETAEKLNTADLALVHSLCERYWRQFRVSFPIKWICVSRTDVYCSSAKQSVYRAAYKQCELKWTKQKYRASRMAVSQSGNIVWRLNLGVLYALKNAEDPDPWNLIARNVESVAVNDWSAWYVSGGLIFVQTELSEERTFGESLKLHCVSPVSKICCFDNNVWALTVNGVILGRDRISRENPLGSDWRTIMHPDSLNISEIALGARNTGWIIDKFNNVYFTDNFANENTDWWQVIIGRHIHKSDSTLSDQLSRFVHWSKEKPSSCVIGSSDDSVWILVNNENVIHINKTALLGHRWSPISVDTSLVYKIKWKFLAAVGECEQTAAVWCLSSSNDLFLYSSKQNYIRAVEMATTADVVCITVVPDLLWILTDKNEIFVRRGISDQTPFGWTWEQLTIYQTENSISAFKHLSIGRDVIWAIGIDDRVYAAVADLYSITCDTFVLNWVPIETSLPAESKLIDVYVGPNKYMVWALDDKYNVYARQSIFDHFPFGSKWVNVPGIKAIHLTLSSSAVWALTVEGYVYRRSGITAEDAIGEYWAQIPGCLSMITASVYENMWGVSKITGRLLKYENHLLGLKEDFIRKRRFSENIEDEWVIIEDVYQMDDDVD